MVKYARDNQMRNEMEDAILRKRRSGEYNPDEKKEKKLRQKYGFRLPDEKGYNEYWQHRLLGTTPLYLQKNLVDYTNVGDAKFQAAYFTDCGKPVSKRHHPYIVFKKPVQQVHLRVRDHYHPERILYDADFLFQEPSKYLDETMPAIRGWKGSGGSLGIDNLLADSGAPAFATEKSAKAAKAVKLSTKDTSNTDVYGKLRFPRLCAYADEEEWERLGKMNPKVAGNYKEEQGKNSWMTEIFKTSVGTHATHAHGPHGGAGKSSSSSGSARSTSKSRPSPSPPTHLHTELVNKSNRPNRLFEENNAVKRNEMWSNTAAFAGDTENNDHKPNKTSSFRSLFSGRNSQPPPTPTEMGHGLCPDPYRPCQIYEMLVSTNHSMPNTGEGESMALQEGPQLPSVNLEDSHSEDNMDFDSGMLSLNNDVSGETDKILFGVQGGMKHKHTYTPSMLSGNRAQPRPQNRDIVDAVLAGKKPTTVDTSKNHGNNYIALSSSTLNKKNVENIFGKYQMKPGNPMNEMVQPKVKAVLEKGDLNTAMLNNYYAKKMQHRNTYER
ncbi:unnamed protein product [Amoebophrya sp. A25]|nr:unnamed protein product [Amoebophrya sp. A25]|eukprot:GSA25T00003806001.1